MVSNFVGNPPEPMLLPLFVVFLYTIAAYLIGSIPFGLLLSKIFGYGDIRKIGSGNIGATNVLRTGNKKLAFITLLLDASKAAVFLLFFRWRVLLTPAERTIPLYM